MFSDDHYFWVSEVYGQADKEYTLEEVDLETKCPTYNLYFDLETINACSAKDIKQEIRSITYPYSNSWALSKVQDIKENTTDPIEIKFSLISNNEEIESMFAFDGMFKDMKLALEASNRTIKFRLIAYNGSKFDFSMLNTYVVRNKYQILSCPSLTGRIDKLVFLVGSKKIKDKKIYGIVEIWDPIRYTASSLENTVKSFKLEITELDDEGNIINVAQGKGKLDHAEFARRYVETLEGKVKQDSVDFFTWLNTPEVREPLRIYNDQDVKLLRLVTLKLNETFQQITSDVFEDQIVQPKDLNYFRIWDTPTLPAMCSKIFKRLNSYPVYTRKVKNPNYIDPESEEKKKRETKPKVYTLRDFVETIGDTYSLKPDYTFKTFKCWPKKVESRYVDRIIRKMIIGGRCHGDHGLHKLLLFMVDIVSLYPTVMNNCRYPVGTEKITSDEETALQLFQNDVLGFYHVRYTSSVRNNHAYLPYRKTGSTDSKYDWSAKSASIIRDEWLPLITIQTLIEDGIEPELIPDPENGWLAIYWDGEENNVREAPIETQEYINKYFSAKDVLDATKEKVSLNTRINECTIPSVSEHTLFQSYIKIFAEIKNKEDHHKSTKNPRYNPVLRAMAKSILNSLSGKQVQRIFDKEHHYSNTTRDLERILKAITDKPKEPQFNIIKERNLLRQLGILDGELEDEDEEGEEEKNDEQVESSFKTLNGLSITPIIESKIYITETLSDQTAYNKSNVPSQVGVFIYAYARDFMWKQIFRKAHVYVTDTDSALITFEDLLKLDNLFMDQDDMIGSEILKELSEEKLKQLEKKVQLGGNKEFGMIDIEAVCTSAAFIGPKSYVFQNTIQTFDEKTKRKVAKTVALKHRIKGVRDTDTWSLAKNTPVKSQFKLKDTICEFYEACLKGDVYVHTWNFTKHMRKLELTHNITAKLLKHVEITELDDQPENFEVNEDSS